MKRHSQNILLLFGIMVIGFSFIIPNEFNELLKSHFSDLLIYNALGFLSVYALILVPVILGLLYFKRIDFAYWVSFVLLVFQVFVIGFMDLLSMKWNEYLFNVIGISIVVLTYNRFIRSRFQNNVILIGLSILYVLGLILMTIIHYDLDNGYSLILFSVAGYGLHRSIKFVDFKVIKMFVFLFYIISLIFLTINLNCNIEFISDIGTIDWSIKNIASRCSTFYCWGIGAMIINYIMILKISKNYVA